MEVQLCSVTLIVSLNDALSCYDYIALVMGD
jgi:hypothetical protein